MLKDIILSISGTDILDPHCNLIFFYGFSQMGQGSKERIGWSQRQKFVTPILRLVSCITSLVDSSEYLEVTSSAKLNQCQAFLLLYFINSILLL